MELAAASAASGVRLIVCDTLGSTNTEALLQARAGDRGPLWIVARRQTEGRGRRGRAWVSQPGNLFASLLLVDPAQGESVPQLSFVAALALHDALVETAGVLGPRLKFKWPNDVLCDGAKLAGILIEGESAARGPLAVAIGIGVNCANAPSDTSYPAVSLQEASALVSPEFLFQVLSMTMLHRLNEWDRGNGFAAIRFAWLARAAGLGEPIRVALLDRTIDGVLETLDESGRLILRLNDGQSEAIGAADVVALPQSAHGQISRGGSHHE